MKHSNNPGGRPLSDTATARLHTAVWAIVRAKGFRGLTFEGVSAEAGVSRTTIYRRYGSVAELTLASLASYGAERIEMQWGDDLEGDLVEYLGSVVRSLRRSGPVGQAFRGLLAHALTEDGFAAAFTAFLSVRRRPVVQRLRAASPQMRARAAEQKADLLFGPLLYKLMIRNKPVPAAEILTVVRAALRCD